MPPKDAKATYHLDKAPSKVYSESTAKASKSKGEKCYWENTTPSFRPPGVFRELILGVCDAGKSAYLKASTLAEIENYKWIFFIGPNILHPRHGLLDIIERAKELGIGYTAFTTFKKNEQRKFYKKLEKFKPSGEPILVIVDDPVGMTHFSKSGNQESEWNSFVCSSKHYNASIKFATQGSVSMAPVCREMMNRIILFPGYDDPKRMMQWCQVLPSAACLTRLIAKYASEPHHSLGIVKYQGYKGLYHISPDLVVTPISGNI